MRSPAPNNQIDPAWQSGGFAARPIGGVNQPRRAVTEPEQCAGPWIHLASVRPVVWWGGLFFLFGLGRRVDGVRFHFRRRWHPGPESLANLLVEVGHGPLKFLDEHLVAGEAGGLIGHIAHFEGSWNGVGILGLEVFRVFQYEAERGLRGFGLARTDRFHEESFRFDVVELAA